MDAIQIQRQEESTGSRIARYGGDNEFLSTINWDRVEKVGVTSETGFRCWCYTLLAKFLRPIFWLGPVRELGDQTADWLVKSLYPTGLQSLILRAIRTLVNGALATKGFPTNISRDFYRVLDVSK